MNKPSRRFPTIMIVIIMVLVMLGCATLFINAPNNATTPDNSTISDHSTTPVQASPQPNQIVSSNSAYTLAQATIDAGQRQLLDLSRKATEVSLNSSQAADASALSTQDANHRQKIELDYQSTLVSLNMAQAAATQRYISQQTKTAKDAAASAAQAIERISSTQTSRAQAALDSLALQTAQAAAAQTAYPLTATAASQQQNVTETIQAQMILYSQGTQAAQAIKTQTAIPLTETAAAVTQAALLMQKYDREQQSFLKQIVSPMIPILAILDLLLFTAWVIRALRRIMPAPWLPRLRIARGYNPLMIDGVIVDADPLLYQNDIPTLLPPTSTLPTDEYPVHVEIMDATEPPVAHWVTEVEHQLTDEGGLTS